MATSNPSQLTIVEPLRFHRVHGEQIELLAEQTRAKRERLSHNMVFTNRPILPNEIVQFLVEEISNDFYGLIRVGLTTIDPDSLTMETLPKTIPTNDPQWFVPTPRGQPNIRKDKIIRLTYNAEGDVSIRIVNRSIHLIICVDPHRFRSDWFRSTANCLTDYKRCLVCIGSKRNGSSNQYCAN